MPQGRLLYDPKIYATGKNRRAIVRRFAPDVFAECTKNLHLLKGKHSKGLRSLIEAHLTNPFYWIARGNSAASEDSLDTIMSIAEHLMTDSKVLPGLDHVMERFKAACIIESHEKEQWIIVRVPPDVVKEQLDGLRSAGVRISGSAWGPHISVLRGETLSEELWSSRPHNGESIEFELGNFRHSRQGYYWYEVTSQRLEDFRIELGLSPRPTPPFHITIGKVC